MNWKEFRDHGKSSWRCQPFDTGAIPGYFADMHDWRLHYDTDGYVSYANGMIGLFNPEKFIPGTPEAEAQAMQCLRDLVNTMQDELSSNA